MQTPATWRARSRSGCTRSRTSLADLERPVAARGVLLTEHLLTDAGSPLYDPAIVRALPFYVDAARDGLEPR